jgi:hypothetical protein
MLWLNKTIELQSASGVEDGQADRKHQSELFSKLRALCIFIGRRSQALSAGTSDQQLRMFFPCWMTLQLQHYIAGLYQCQTTDAEQLNRWL